MFLSRTVVALMSCMYLSTVTATDIYINKPNFISFVTLCTEEAARAVAYVAEHTGPRWSWREELNLVRKGRCKSIENLDFFAKRLITSRPALGAPNATMSVVEISYTQNGELHEAFIATFLKVKVFF